MSTALQIITDAMLKATIIASGDVLSAEESNDGLRALNDLFENLSLERQSVYGRYAQTFPLVINQGSYTIGVGGNFNTTRPVRIDDLGWVSFQGVDYPIEAMGPDEYALMVLKNQPGLPQRFFYINDNPLGILKLWPVPDQAMSISLNIDRLLTSIPNLTTQLVLPPGYELMIKCLLADMLAPEYGVILPPAVAEQAAKFKADVKRANRVRRVARFDDIPGVVGTVSYDWRTGV